MKTYLNYNKEVNEQGGGSPWVEPPNEGNEVTRQVIVEEIVVIIIREYAQEGKPIPPHQTHHHYLIQVDKETKEVDVPQMTGGQILGLFEHDPKKTVLRQVFRDGEKKVIANNEIVDFTAPGIERFVTMPLDDKGGADLRREFALSDTDVKFLNQNGLPWETVLVGNERWLFLQDFELPVGYNIAKINTGLLIPANYPDSEIDMFFLPNVIERMDQKPIMQVTGRAIGQETWQQWSRHRTDTNPWQPGEDDISTHLELVKFSLNKALEG